MDVLDVFQLINVNKTLELNSLYYQACVLKVLKSLDLFWRFKKKTIRVENLPKITMVVTV